MQRRYNNGEYSASGIAGVKIAAPHSDMEHEAYPRTGKFIADHTTGG